jgi:anti-anti-sigma factor
MARGHTWLASYYPVRGTDGAIAWLGAFVVDITERKRAEARAQALADLATALDEAMTAEDRLSRLLDVIVPTVADAATAWLYRGDGTLEPVGRRNGGDAYESQLTVALAVRGRAIGMLELAAIRPDAFGDEDHAFAAEVARRAAMAVDNAQLLEAERVARDRTERQYAVAAALADALTATDVAAAILSEVVDAVGGEQGTVWTVSDDGAWVELIGARGFTEHEMEGHQRAPLDAARPVADAIRRRTVLSFATAAETDDAYPVFHGVFARRGLRSVLVVPLLSLGRAVGGLLLSSTRERAFGADERALASALAAQAGQALERARLFEAERNVSVTLQRSLLPAQLPEVEGVEVAVRYEPAAGLEAGGDFYEALPLPDGSIGIAVGDVVGRGAPAAAAMGQLRSALRAFALVGESPGAILGRLSAFAETVDGAMASTAVVARLRPDTGELRYACAGHPWPLLVHADGTVEYLRAGRGVPLACLREATFSEGVAHLRPGSSLLLYTDGLTERRGTDVDTVLARLAEAAGGAASAPVGDLLDRAFSAAGDDAPADDVALVAVRRAGGDAARVLHFAAEPAQVPAARAAMRAWLDGLGVDAATAGDLLLAAGEAVANAVEHSGSDEVTVELTLPEPGMVGIVVLDEGTWKDPVVASHRGRGFGLMRMLLDEVAVERSPGGTTVRLRHRFTTPLLAAPEGEAAPAEAGCGVEIVAGVARVTGELDLSCAPRIRDEVLAARPSAIDLTAVAYLDSTGARMLFEVAEALGTPLIIVAPVDSAPRRTLDLSGLTELLDVRDD